MTLQIGDWLAPQAAARTRDLIDANAGASSDALKTRLEALAVENRQRHEGRAFNLNPATNVMNPRAEALLAAGIGTRPSLGHPGDKYETGLQSIEEIEVIAASLAAEVFAGAFAEVRVASGALANLYTYMATCTPGDTIIAPPASIGGHVTHHAAGCAGLFHLNIVEAPVAPDGYTVDVDALAALAREVRPRLITLGGSLNLFEHPVAEVAQIARDVGARLMFDAAHQCGIIAGGAWANPLDLGADVMNFSTYKSLGGPAGGLIVTRDAELAARLDAIAFPGLTANFDAGRVAALAVSLLDWRDHGAAYARQMIDTAQALAGALDALGLPVFAKARGFTQSHQFALEAADFGGGQSAARHLEPAGFLACGIGLPIGEVPGDMNGLRIGTPELVRWGVTPEDAPELADLIARALRSDTPAALHPEVQALRDRFRTLHYISA